MAVAAAVPALSGGAAGAAVSLVTPGHVAAVGGAPTLGSPDANAKRPVGLAVTPGRNGYWVVGADGGVFSYGDAAFHGSHGGSHLNQPIVGIAATPTGRGYWLAAADGGVFTYGDAAFHGSLAGAHPALGVSTIVTDPGGSGYWLVGRDGSVHAYGAASMTGAVASAAAPVVAAGAGPRGLWELAGSPPPRPSATVPVSATSAGRPLGTFVVTCYDLSGTTASGAPVGTNVVAVDPSVIPLGSKIAIDGVGVRTALDTGGAIVGNRLDIWEPTYSACASWGVQSRAVSLLS